jgi:hypothetical protein
MVLAGRCGSAAIQAVVTRVGDRDARLDRW